LKTLRFETKKILITVKAYLHRFQKVFAVLGVFYPPKEK